METSIIETEALTRRFGGLTAVNGLELRVPPGAVYGFLGPNGAGKTTTIRLLLGLIRPHSGKVRLFGRDLKRCRREILGRIGFLVETPALYRHLTGRENLEMIRRMRGLEKDRVEETLETVDLRAAAGKKVEAYSLGMRQRLGLSLALLGRPDLLILDEPTNGLDPAGISEIRGMLRRLAGEQGLTIFLSSHLLGEVEQTAEFIGVIHEGSLRFQGTMAQLRDRRRGRLELGVDRPEPARRVLAGKGWRIEPSPGGRLWIEVKDGAADAARINALLVESGCGVHHLRLQSPSLEEFFLNLTGSRERGGE